MPYGTIKVDTVTFTDAGVDKSVSISGLVQNPTFSGNVTVTGTISGVTVTGTTASFTSGNFTNISVGTYTITSGVFSAGSETNPSISFTSDPNTGIYSPGADQVAISTGGSGRLFVDASGNVGVNTSSPSTYGRFAVVDSQNGYVSSTFTNTSNGSGAVNRIQIGNDASSGAGQLVVYGSQHSTLPNIFDINNATNAALRFLTNNTERLRITSAGLVGVGTTSPSTALDVNGGFQVTGSVTGFSGGEVRLGGTGSSLESAISTQATGSPMLLFDHRGTSNTGIFVWRNGSIGSSERMRLDASGRLGIGTSSPANQLHVVGGGLFASSTTTGTLVQARNSDVSSLGYFGVEGSTGGVTLTGTLANATLIASGAAGTPLQFGTGGVIRATLTSTGLGIGTTSPARPLDVNGSVRLSSGSVIEFGGTVTNFITGDNSSNYLAFGTNSSERARIDSSGRLLVGTSTSTALSDGEEPFVQVKGTDSRGGLSLARFSNDNQSCGLYIGKSRGASIGSNTIVTSGDELGRITFSGSDGTDLNTQAASIKAEVDGTPGANDMPGRLVFSTTADGESSPTERMRIAQNGVITIQNGAVAVIGTLTDGATITPDFAADCNFTVTLGGNRTIANPTNITAGQSGSIFIVQDVTGSRTLSWGSYWDFPGGTAPTLSTAANAVDRIDYIVRSSTSIHTVFTANYS